MWTNNFEVKYCPLSNTKKPNKKILFENKKNPVL